MNLAFEHPSPQPSTGHSSEVFRNCIYHKMPIIKIKPCLICRIPIKSIISHQILKREKGKITQRKLFGLSKERPILGDHPKISHS